ncbi:MAG: hypothetical protein P0S95_04835 [Rhabdochlamydiaceae bacterium]|nr:hypothetical protein [Candidatus Amphrikana amoebophyrae]
MLEQMEKFLFSSEKSKLPKLFWVSLISTFLIQAFVGIKGVTVFPILMIFSLISLPLSFRFQWQGAVASSLSLIILAMALRSMIPEGLSFFFSLAILGMLANYWLISFSWDHVDSSSSKEEKEKYEKEIQLWKHRFDLNVAKYEKEKEAFESKETEFQAKEDEYYDSLDSLNQLMEISRGENQRVFEQNQILIEESSGYMQRIAYLEAKDVGAESEEKIKQLQKELNEVRVQHYQDKLLYEHFKKETEELSKRNSKDEKGVELASEEVQLALEENLEKPAQENIYLNIN